MCRGRLFEPNSKPNRVKNAEELRTITERADSSVYGADAGYKPACSSRAPVLD